MFREYKFIFEDNEYTPSSCLLRNSFNGKNIYFSGGVGNILEKLKEVYEADCLHYVYIDLVPNNEETVSDYMSLRDYVNAEYSDNVVVIPIVCIERIIMQMLNKYNYFVHSKKSGVLFECIGDDFKWQLLPEEYKDVSLEHLYKLIISSQILFCQQNVNRAANRIQGQFYRLGCDECVNRRCQKDLKDSLRVKAERLYTSLPVFKVVSDEHAQVLNELKIRFRASNVPEILQGIQKDYDKICKQMNLDYIEICS